MADTAFILIVDAESPAARALRDELRGLGHACHLVESADEAVDSVRKRSPDVVIAEQRLSDGETGLALLGRVRQISPASELILMTDGADGRSARAAIKEVGAFDVLVRPLADGEALRVVSAAARAARERRAAVDARRQYDALEPLEGVIASSAAMMAAMARVRKLAKSKLTVLIYGDSGTGKELVARAIHNQSNRSERPWLATNCAGFSEGVLESELFGHVKGAFTGAVADRRGLFEEADGGTLFLDEIGDMPLAMQAKLLRTLENGEIVRVGSNRATHVDVRVVAATNKNLKEQVEQGKFRDDLFWRLNQATIFLAPLRDRREDIPPLVHHFIQQANAAHHKRVAGISHDAMALLVRYNWPGNVRQLANVVNQMVVLAEADALDVHDITDPAIRGNTEIVPVSAAVLPNMTLREIEKRAIQLALRQHDGNREKAARQLGIGARTLYRKLREFDIK